MRKWIAIALLLCLAGCSKKGRMVNPLAIDEPDRVLYENALKQLDRHDYPVARELLQTLISTYQESDYFEKAKYALAESFYREGGRVNLDSAEAAYKDFIIYFRDSDLADDAQMMVAMTHIKRVQTPDRDSTEARLAELELREMIASYPDSNLLEEAKQKLREVQEVLAAGDAGIASQYFKAKNFPASLDRFEEIESKWPDYSKMDAVLYYHAESLRGVENPEASGKLYAEVVSDYPASPFVKLAAQRLMELSLPVPSPNPAATRRAEEREKNVIDKTFSVFKSHPMVPPTTTAASVGDKSGVFAIESKDTKD